MSHRTVRSRRLPALFAGIVLCAGLTVVAGSGVPAQAADLDNVDIVLQPFASGLSGPVAIAWRNSDARMYVAEQTGSVRVVSTSGVVSPTAVVTVSVAGGNEQGLLGLTFSPDGTKLYIFYVDTGSNLRIVEYTMSGDVAGSPRNLLTIPHPRGNHNGGQIAIGPDGKLYIATGDGGGAGDPDENGQNVNTLLGKILRIDPTPGVSLPYTIPSDNPFVGQAGHREEIWMYGLRNPWRFSFDRDTDELWIADVGQGDWEEVDVAAAGEKGSNWGWNLREGFHPFEGGAQPGNGQNPEFELSHDDGYCAVIGGFVYRGSAIPNLEGAYVFSDNCNSNIAAYADGDQVEFAASANGTTTFGEAPDGELYVADLDGNIKKIVAGVTPTISIGEQSMVEGDGSTRKMTFTVTLSHPATKSVTARYTVIGGTATASKSKGLGIDLKSASGNVSIKKGTISKTFSAQVFGDTIDEPNETFTVFLSSPSNGYALGRSTATGRILDDDGGPVPGIGIGDATVVRATTGEQNMVFPITLTAKAPATFTVSYTVDPDTATHSATATGGGDFGGPLTGSIKFSRSKWLQNLSIPIWPGGSGDDSFTVTLTGVNPAGVTVIRATGTGTLLDE